MFCFNVYILMKIHSFLKKKLDISKQFLTEFTPIVNLVTGRQQKN